MVATDAIGMGLNLLVFYMSLYLYKSESKIFIGNRNKVIHNWFKTQSKFFTDQ